MDEKTRAGFEARAEIAKALAHPTRLFIIDVLSRNEKCVGELTDLVGADMSTVSKHLAVLRNAGIVRDEKRGAKVWYNLHMCCVLSFFTCAEECLRTAARDQLSLIND